MNKVFIIGAGGFAKEVFFLLKQIYQKKLNFAGFIDKDIPPGFSNSFLTIKEDEFLNQYKASDSIDLYLGIGFPSIAIKILKKFEGYNFPNAIHPNFQSDFESISLGIGNIITAGVIFTIDIKVLNFNIFNLNTTIGHDCSIGSFNVFNPGCNISGGCLIGSGNLFGTNATVLQNLSIGDHSVIGASALVTKAVPSKKLVIGIPGKVIKDL